MINGSNTAVQKVFVIVNGCIVKSRVVEKGFAVIRPESLYTVKSLVFVGVKSLLSFEHIL